MRTRFLPPASSRLILGLFTALIAPFSVGAQVVEDGFTPLFNGESLSGWVVEGADPNAFAVTSGVLRVSGPRGWLRSSASYSNFTLRLDFRFLTAGADSGVFFRAATLGGFGRGWPNNSYQIQLRDMHSPSNFLPLAHLYRHGMPQGETVHTGPIALEGFRGVGEWHQIEITVEGESVVVLLDSREVLRGGSIGNESGYIGLQGEAGEVEYRLIRIQEK